MTSYVPSKARYCANAQYYQTMSTMISHSRALVTFQI